MKALPDEVTQKESHLQSQTHGKAIMDQQLQVEHRHMNQPSSAESGPNQQGSTITCEDFHDDGEVATTLASSSFCCLTGVL